MKIIDLTLRHPTELGKLYFRPVGEAEMFYGPFEDDAVCVAAMRVMDRRRKPQGAFPYEVVEGRERRDRRLLGMPISEQQLLALEWKRTSRMGPADQRFIWLAAEWAAKVRRELGGDKTDGSVACDPGTPT